MVNRFVRNDEFDDDTAAGTREDILPAILAIFLNAEILLLSPAPVSGQCFVDFFVGTHP